jgi:hypothetical protein
MGIPTVEAPRQQAHALVVVGPTKDVPRDPASGQREVREGGAEQEHTSTYGELCETRQMIET